MVVGVAVGSLSRDSLEAPTVRLANEGTELGVIEVQRDHFHFELTWLVDLPRTTVWHPTDNVRQIRT